MEKSQVEKDLYFINEQIAKLRSMYKRSKKRSWVESITIGFLTLTVISVSLYLMYYLMNNYDNSNKNLSWFNAIGPQVLIMTLSILLFLLIFFMSIFRSMIRIRRYEQAFERIETISSQYLQKFGKYKSANRLMIYREEITLIVNKTIFWSSMKLK